MPRFTARANPWFSSSASTSTPERVSSIFRDESVEPLSTTRTGHLTRCRASDERHLSSSRARFHVGMITVSLGS